MARTPHIFRIYHSTIDGITDDRGYRPEREHGCNGARHVDMTLLVRYGKNGVIADASMQHYQEQGPCNSTCGGRGHGSFSYAA